MENSWRYCFSLVDASQNTFKDGPLVAGGFDPITRVGKFSILGNIPACFCFLRPQNEALLEILKNSSLFLVIFHGILLQCHSALTYTLAFGSVSQQVSIFFEVSVSHLFEKGIWLFRIENLITSHHSNQIIRFTEVDDVSSLSQDISSRIKQRDSFRASSEELAARARFGK